MTSHIVEDDELARNRVCRPSPVPLTTCFKHSTAHKAV